MAMGISPRCTPVPWWQRVHCWLYPWQWGSLLSVQRYCAGRGCIVGCIYGNRDLFWMYTLPWWRRVYCWLYPWRWGSLLDVHRYRCGGGCIVGCIHGDGDLLYQYSGTVLICTVDVQWYSGGRWSIVGCIYGNGDPFWMYSGTVVAEGVLLAVSMAMRISSGCTAVPWWQRVYCWLHLWQWGSLLDVHRYRDGRGCIVGCINCNGDLFWMYSGTVLAEGVLLAVSMAMGISSGCTVVPWWRRVYCWLYLWQCGSLLGVQWYRGGGGCIVGCIYGNVDLGLLLAVSMAMGISSECTEVPWWRRVYCWLYLWQWGSLLDVHRYRDGRGCIVGCIHSNGDLFHQYSGTVLAEGLLLAVSMAIGTSSWCTAVPWGRRIYCWLYPWQWGSLISRQRYCAGRRCIVGCINGNEHIF